VAEGNFTHRIGTIAIGEFDGTVMTGQGTGSTASAPGTNWEPPMDVFVSGLRLARRRS
jgi:hypothetical protein